MPVIFETRQKGPKTVKFDIFKEKIQIAVLRCVPGYRARCRLDRLRGRAVTRAKIAIRDAYQAAPPETGPDPQLIERLEYKLDKRRFEWYDIGVTLPPFVPNVVLAAGLQI